MRSVLPRQEMERFKVLEKETKTKAYSKEGLQQIMKKKKDPKKDIKYPTYKWLDECKASLKKQIADMDGSPLSSSSRQTILPPSLYPPPDPRFVV
jgi:CCR4-NOT transcriptional regulation complex NOT5 subunit